MSDPTKAAVAYPHWEACESCINFDPDYQCDEMELSSYLGDWIICENYEEKKA